MNHKAYHIAISTAAQELLNEIRDYEQAFRDEISRIREECDDSRSWSKMSLDSLENRTQLVAMLRDVIVDAIDGICEVRTND